MSASGEPITRLVASLKRLAADAATQASYLAGIGTGGRADELALEFDDAYQPVRARQGELGFSPTTSEGLGRLDALLAEMSGPQNADLWTLNALQNSVRWSNVRQVAEAILPDLEKSLGI
jgi:hypothetical protein